MKRENNSDLTDDEVIVMYQLLNKYRTTVSKLKILHEIDRNRVASIISQSLQLAKETLLYKTWDQITEMVFDRFEKLNAVVCITAKELRSSEKATLQHSINKIFSGVVHVLYKVNPEIIGGIVIEWQGQMFDGSYATMLESIEKKFLENMGAQNV